MGVKSRTSYRSFCIKKCINRGEKCENCYRFSHYEERVDESKQTAS